MTKCKEFNNPAFWAGMLIAPQKVLAPNCGQWNALKQIQRFPHTFAKMSLLFSIKFQKKNVSCFQTINDDLKLGEKMSLILAQGDTSFNFLIGPKSPEKYLQLTGAK